MHPLKNPAVAQSDFAQVKVGDGFKMIGDVGRRGLQRRDVAIANRLAIEPFPQPAAFEFVGVEAADINGVLAVPGLEIVVFGPEIKLVDGMVGTLAINERLTRAGGVAGGRRIK